MEHNTFILARVIHILAVVMWIGGVAFVTTILLPAIRKTQDASARLELFETLEGRFAFQAKITTLFAGVSGIYMLEVMDAWSRYYSIHFWWMHLMTVVWLIFTLVLFVLEPLFLKKWFHEQAKTNSERVFRILQTMHIILLSISLIAVTGAMAGAHGYSF